MIKKILPLFIMLLVTSILPCGCVGREASPLGMAVEFTDHAACAYISLDKGWYQEAGLELQTYESYATGVALASALTRGDIQVAYMCLVPAIVAAKNGGVPLKIVAGTHKYGYGLVVDSAKIKEIKDMENSGIRLGCVNEGTATDIVLQKTIDSFNLDREKVLKNVQRMSPSKQLLALKGGQLDAVFVPEHWATVAQEMGFKMLQRSQDVWPELQGSVLAVKADLIQEEPETVRKIVEVSQKATIWIKHNQAESAAILCRYLNGTQGLALPEELSQITGQFEIKEETLLRSLANLEFDYQIDPFAIQETIDYLAALGYIRASFPAGEILDLRFIQNE